MVQKGLKFVFLYFVHQKIKYKCKPPDPVLNICGSENGPIPVSVMALILREYDWFLSNREAVITNELLSPANCSNSTSSMYKS